VPALAERGIVCDVAIGRDGPGGERLRRKGIPVISLELMRSRVDPMAVVAMSRLLRRHRPTHVHLHGTRAAFFGVLARNVGAAAAARWIYTAHGLSFRKETGATERAVYRGVEATICRGVDGVISVSRLDRDALAELAPTTPAVHLPNAVDADVFRPRERGAARRRLDLDPDAFVVGTVARLVPQKAVADLLAAAALLEGSDLAVVVVGDGEERAALADQARQLGGRVRLLGQRDDIAEILPALDLFVSSSRWEGEPIAILEAMAAGLPVITTDTPGGRELIEASGAGRIVPVADPPALAAAVSTLRGAPEARAEMAVAARRLAEGRSVALVAKRVAELYQRLADG